MNDLKVFSNTEFGELGVMLIDGKEYFPASQCAKILGYANPRDAIQKRCKEDGVAKCDVIDSLGRTQQMKFINEGNLYRLIISSKLPAAEKFERWVFDEVLPSIRKNGSYGDINIEELVTKTATAVVTEVMKQILPILNKKEIRETIITTVASSDDTEVKRYRFRMPSKIEMLEPNLRAIVDDMICSGNYSCQQIANYIMNNSDTKISQTAVNKYAHRFFWD